MFSIIFFLNPFFFSGAFSFFAVFGRSHFEFFSDVIRKLGSGIPNKTKFVVGRSREMEISEALQVFNLYHFSKLVKILNKRWQTLDLVSMVQELKRSCFAQIWTLGNINLRLTVVSPKIQKSRVLKLIKFFHVNVFITSPRGVLSTCCLIRRACSS